MNNSGCLLVSWCFSNNEDNNVLIVGENSSHGTVIVNAFQGEEARALYEQLVGKKGEEK